MYLQHFFFSLKHLPMLSLREGGPWAHVGHLTSIAFPTLGNLIKNLGPRVGAFAFFDTEEWDQVTSSHVLICLPAILELKWRSLSPERQLFLIKASSCFYIHTKLYFSLLNFKVGDI